MGKHNCCYCGGPVEKEDLQHLGRRMVFVCDAEECSRALQDEDRAAYEEECDRLREDWYGP